jgi:hypothetical protein
MILDKLQNLPSIRILTLITALLLCQPSYGQTSAESSPSGVAMAADLVIGRPALLVMTSVGFAVWMVSLPLALIGGNAEETGKTLVVDPARATFARCLGCNTWKYKN